MININLLPPKHVFTQKEREIRRKILIFLIVFSSVFTLIFGVVFGGRLYFGSRLAAYDREQKTYQDQLSELSQLGWNVSSIEFKLAGVKYIKKNQHPFSEPLAKIKDLTTGLVTVSRVELSPQFGVEFTGNTKNKPDLEAFLRKFTQNDPETKFLKEVTIKNLQQRESFQFGFLVSGKYLPGVNN